MGIELPLAADIYVAVLVFCIGACLGSFITCAADRYVAKESVLKGRSKCPVCGHTLGFFDLIPIFSYLFLRGRCRRCASPIPMRCFFTELLTALVLLATYLRCGFSFVTVEYVFLFSLLLAVALIDRDTMEIPDGLVLAGAIAFLIFLYPHGGDILKRLGDGVLGALVYGGGMLLLALLMDRVLGKESLGGGDIKLFAMLGLYTGLACGLLMLLISCITGLLFSLTVRKKGSGGEFPFGPAIAVGATFALLVGQDFIGWYLSLIL